MAGDGINDAPVGRREDEEIGSVNGPTDHKVSVSHVLRGKVESQHLVRAGSYATVINLVLIPGEAGVDAEIAKSAE